MLLRHLKDNMDMVVVETENSFVLIFLDWIFQVSIKHPYEFFLCISLIQLRSFNKLLTELFLPWCVRQKFNVFKFVVLIKSILKALINLMSHHLWLYKNFKFGTLIHFYALVKYQIIYRADFKPNLCQVFEFSKVFIISMMIFCAHSQSFHSVKKSLAKQVKSWL